MIRTAILNEHAENNIIIYNTDDGKANVKLYTSDGTIWATQKAIADLFDRSRSVITKHINSIFADNELNRESNVQKMNIAISEQYSTLYTRRIYESSISRRLL